MIDKDSVRSTASPRRRNTPTNPCAKIITPAKLSAAVITGGPSSPSSWSESVLPRSPTKHRSAQNAKRHSELGHQARPTPTTTDFQQREDESPDDLYADGPIEILPGIYIGPEDVERWIVLNPDGAGSRTVSDRPSLKPSRPPSSAVSDVPPDSTASPTPIFHPLPFTQNLPFKSYMLIQPPTEDINPVDPPSNNSISANAGGPQPQGNIPSDFHWSRFSNPHTPPTPSSALRPPSLQCGMYWCEEEFGSLDSLRCHLEGEHGQAIIWN